MTVADREVLAAVSRRLADRRARLTRGRRAVLRTLTTAKGPLSASEILAGVQEPVPISSLYRSLAVLEDAEVLVRHHDRAGLARFELAEWLSGHHHHLVCIDCGEVEDVEPTPTMEATLRALASDVSRRSEFEPRGHTLDIEGTCSGCRTT